jgi:hypothetical protein
MTSLAAPLPSATPRHPSLRALVAALQSATPARVLCSPCSTTNEVFSVLATFADHKPVWAKASCLAALSSQKTEVDVEKGIRNFRAQFKTLYDDFGAVNVADLDNALTVDASIGDTTTATTAKVHLLPDGDVVCFETQDWMPRPELSILQRTTYAGARTFDALLLFPAAKDKRDRALELRLVEKQHLSGVVEWGDRAGTTTVCSSGAPLSAQLVLRAFADGSTCDEVVNAIVGDDSESEPDSDVEWCESDDSMDESDDSGDSGDSDFDAAAAEEELENLR